MNARRQKQRGFSLLEVLIAFAIITVVAASVYIMQSNSLFSSLRTKNMLIASNLARGFLAKSELELEPLDFNLLKEEEEGKFPEPYEEFKWKREVKEQDFSALSKIVSDLQSGVDSEFTAAAGGPPGADRPEASDVQTLVAKVFENYLKDSIRTLKITILWTEDGKEKSVSFTTLLVRYDAQLRTTL